MKKRYKRKSFLFVEEMRSHVAAGGRLSHPDAVVLLKEVERLQKGIAAMFVVGSEMHDLGVKLAHS